MLFKVVSSLSSLSTTSRKQKCLWLTTICIPNYLLMQWLLLVQFTEVETKEPMLVVQKTNIYHSCLDHIAWLAVPDGH